MNIFSNLFKKEDEDEFDVEVIERKARRIGESLTEITEKYDERTEELLELLREKADGLWDCRTYYDSAMQLKGEIKNIKSEKGNKMQEIAQLKRQWGEMASYILKNDIYKEPSCLEELIIYLQLIQFADKSDYSSKSILAMMKKFHITKEEIEKDYTDLYSNLKMKDW